MRILILFDHKKYISFYKKYISFYKKLIDKLYINE